MESTKRWLSMLAIILVAITIVGSIGAFTLGWHSGGSSAGMMGGMHASWWWDGGAQGEPISNEEAVHTAESFIRTYGGEDVQLMEVMVFDNHFYAQAAEV